jgi:hypothetical protein
VAGTAGAGRTTAGGAVVAVDDGRVCIAAAGVGLVLSGTAGAARAGCRAGVCVGGVLRGDSADAGVCDGDVLEGSGGPVAVGVVVVVVVLVAEGA